MWQYCEDCGRSLGYNYPSLICPPWLKDGCHYNKETN